MEPDLIGFKHLLNTEETLIYDTTLSFVKKSVLPVITKAYEEAFFQRSWIEELANLGLLGLTLPESVGGANCGAVSYGLVCQALEQGDSALRSFVSVQNSLCMFPIFTYGSVQQQERWLPLMAQGKVIGCFGLTEPQGGSDPNAMETYAKKVEGGWLINGSKQWITNAPIADLAIIWARTEQGIRGWIVETEREGFDIQTIPHKMSLRASPTGSLFLNDCFVPDSHYLPGSDIGLKAPLSCLTQARYGVAWGAIGAGITCFEMALDYSQNRTLFKRPLIGHQLIQKSLSEAYTALSKAQLLNLHVGRLKEQGPVNPTLVSMAKRDSCHTALTVARNMRDLLGGNGISLDYHVIRHMMNLESVSTYEGTDNIHHLILGQYLSGIPAFE